MAKPKIFQGKLSERLKDPLGTIGRLFSFGGGEDLQAPGFVLPEWAQGLPPEILNIIRGQVGAQLPIPPEFGMAGQAFQDILALQPQQFQFPVADIQQALAAQQAQQLQEYQQLINPLLAARGQFDSSTRENLLSQFLTGQQTQRLGTTADLLTQQALQNLQLQQFFPQLRAGVAGQLAGLGGQRANIGQFNLQLPFQTTIPALQQMFGAGMQRAGQQFQANLLPYQQQLQQQAQQQQLLQSLGQLAGTAAGAYFGGPVGAGIGGQLGGQLGGGSQNLQFAQPTFGQTGFGTQLSPAQSQSLNQLLFNQQSQAPSLRFPFQFGGS